MKVAVIGSTGSVGTQALNAIRKLKGFSVCALVAYSNGELVSRQAKEFLPEYTALISVDGRDCIKRAVDICDIALIATSGITALEGVLLAIERGVPVALANKESLVCGGELINEALKRYGGFIRPVDSEHSAIWQCIDGRNEDVRSIIITASGGAFRGLSREEIAKRKASDALKHPTWSMGRKITVDSATLMNKAFEVIEAYYLFGKKPVVTVHPQSIVHSMAEFKDGSVCAQLACPDMALPISYALTYPERGDNVVKGLSFTEQLNLTFGPVDKNAFPCITLADRILDGNKRLAAVMNGADDACVEAYLDDRIGFYDIFDIISQALCDAEAQPEQSGLFLEGVEGVYKRNDFGKRRAIELIRGPLNN